MKHLRKVLSLAIAALMLLAMLPSELTVHAIGLSHQEKEIIHWNPRYPEHDRVWNPDGNSHPVSAYSDVTHTKEEDAALEIRQYLKERVTQFTISIESFEQDFGALMTKLMDQAMAHTGVPTEGDYLAWQYAGWSTKCKSRTLSSGKKEYNVTITMQYYTTAEQEATVTTEVERLLKEWMVRATMIRLKKSTIISVPMLSMTIPTLGLVHTKHLSIRLPFARAMP